jgi:G3E family GTPase
MVTVVDASNFLELYASTEKVSERADLGGDELLKDEPGLEVWALPEELPPTPSVVQLLIEQVETADVLVLNKVDGVDAAGLAYLSDALGHINGFATLLPAKFGNVAPSQVLVGEREAGVALSNEVIDEPAPIEL